MRKRVQIALAVVLVMLGGDGVAGRPSFS